MVFRLAHLSDPHLGPMPPAGIAELASKRILGYLNWYLHRSRHMMQGDHIASVLADIADATPDHIAVTGDLINIGLPHEITNARAWLSSIGTSDTVSLVPGNHDAYVRDTLAQAIAAWGPHLTGDGCAEPGFPYVRRRSDIVVIGVSTAIATGPFMATGRIDAPQLQRLAHILAETGLAGLCRVILMHHPAIEGAAKWKSRLIDAEQFRSVIAQTGAELVLHGHTHTSTVNWMDGPVRPIPVVGVQAASLQPSHLKRGAGWNLFEISGQPGNWRIIHTDRGFAAGSLHITQLARTLLAPA